MMPEQLGLYQKTLDVLRLPRGLWNAGYGWFEGSDIKQIIIPNCVKVLGPCLFKNCKLLREVTFAPYSRLKYIGDNCFENCGLTEIVIPRSFQAINDSAFYSCLNLSSLRFEWGSLLNHVGDSAFGCTKLRLENVKYPDTFRTEWNEW